MKHLKKATFATALSLLLGSSYNATATTDKDTEHNIHMAVKADRKIEVIVDKNAMHAAVELSKDALKNADILATELAHLSADEQQMIKDALKGIDLLDKEHDGIKVFAKTMSVSSDSDHSRSGEAKVIVMDIDGNSGSNMTWVTESDSMKKLIMLNSGESHGANHEVKFITDGAINVGIIEELLKSTNFSASELDKLQQILDSKR